MSATTPEARADITARRQAGESMAAIARIHGISRERVRQLCDKWGVKCPVDLRRVPEALLDQAVALVKEGAPTRAAAKAVGISDLPLRQRLKELGLDLESRRLHRYDGRVFDLWTVVAGGYDSSPENHNKRSILCRCVCGTERRVGLGNLLSGASRGCGCRSKGGSTVPRVRVPWVCEQTGEQLPNTSALALRAGVSSATVYRRLHRGRAFIDSQGNIWTAQPEQAVDHNPARTEAAA